MQLSRVILGGRFGVYYTTKYTDKMFYFGLLIHSARTPEFALPSKMVPKFRRRDEDVALISFIGRVPKLKNWENFSGGYVERPPTPLAQGYTTPHPTPCTTAVWIWSWSALSIQVGGSAGWLAVVVIRWVAPGAGTGSGRHPETLIWHFTLL